jgi:hypothetical protein
MKTLQCLFLVIALLASGCTPQAVSQVTSTQAAATQPPALLPSATSEPSATPQPGRVIFLSPAGSSAQAAQAALDELSAAAGLTLETQSELQPGGLDSTVRVVVALAPPANLNDLVAAAPQTQFVVMSPADLSQAGNLTVIRWRPENQAFLGGFLAVLLSKDWRSGGLLPGDGPLGASLQEAFVNGGRYFCGVCAPGWPLGLTYPQVTALPAASDGPSWQSAAAVMFDNAAVEAYYLSDEAYRQEVFDYLQGKDQFGNTVLVAGTQPPPDALRGQWAATIRFDIPGTLRQVWPDLLAGKGGAVVEAPLALSDVNPENLGQGRQRLVNDLIEELRTGSLYPFTVPFE